MIIDTVKNAASYAAVHPAMEKAMEFIRDCMENDMTSGRYELDGDNLYALVMSYEPRERQELRYESHENYIDIQCMVRGSEYQWCTDRDQVEVTAEYSPAKDVTFYGFSGQGHKLHLTEGTFAMYFPQDVHLPGVADETARECTRVVVKIRV